MISDNKDVCILYVCCAVLSCFSAVWLSATPWTVARQASLSMGFSRQECWSRLPCPPPEDLPDPDVEPRSLMSPALAGGFFTTSATWEEGCAITNPSLQIRKLRFRELSNLSKCV